jgi:hypothetical protein
MRSCNVFVHVQHVHLKIFQMNKISCKKRARTDKNQQKAQLTVLAKEILPSQGGGRNGWSVSDADPANQ